MRSLRVVILLVCALVVGACSGGGTASPSASSLSSAAPASGRPSVVPVPVFSEVAVGENRALWSFLDPATNTPAATPERTMSIRFTGPGGETVGPVEGEFIWAIEDERGVYATTVDFPVAGAWTAQFTTTAPGAPTETIEFGFDVREEASALRPGEEAPAVDTPTADDVGGDLAQLSTDEQPEARFYETSVAEALGAGEPFVLAFATPKFCATAQCGPTLDRLKPVAEAHPEVTFINVEPYQLELVDGQLQPVLSASGQLQPVEAVGAFGILSEPYVFVVDGDGTITASFEAIFGEDEIEEAVAALG